MLSDAQKIRLEKASRIGKKVWFKDKYDNRKSRLWGTVKDEVYILVADYKHMIQRIELAKGITNDGSKYAYRTGYYTFDAGHNHVLWGQYTQCLTEKQYNELLNKARGSGWTIV
jgi:hypothetical protein